MESLQRLVRSLKSARSVELPTNTKSAYFMLLSYIMQNEHKTLADLLGTSTTFDVNFCYGRYGTTLLHMAANVGAYECLCHLLKKGAIPETFDRQGISPLQVASRNGFIRCVTKLLEYGADITTKNNEGMTAIHWLASNGRTEVFIEINKYLTDNCINIEDENGQTPLHVASLNGHRSTVVKLIELKADLEKKDVNGCTPLFFACWHGQCNVVKELLNCGAILQHNFQKESPLNVALKGGYGKVCLELVEWSPPLMSKLLIYCQSSGIEKSKIVDVLKYISSQNIQYRNMILLQFSKFVHAQGMQLMSQSKDTNLASLVFIKHIEIFNSLLCYSQETESSNDIARQRINSSSVRPRSASVSNTFENKPENFDEILTEFQTLWDTMENWMSVLHNEISLPNSNYLSHSEDPETSSIRSFGSHLRSSDSHKFVRSVSRTSTNLEQLRLTQPAYTVNNADDESSFYLSRSDSYSNALSEIGDDFERTLSPSSEGSDELNLQKLSEASNTLTLNETSNVQTLNKTSDNPRQYSNDDSIAEEGNLNTSSNDENLDVNIVDLTADRLCAAIHGFHLYCKARPPWEKKYDKRAAFGRFLQKHEEVLLMLVSRKSQLIFEHFSFLLENSALLQRFLPAIHCQPLVDRQKWFYERLYADKDRNSAVFDESSVIHVTRDSLMQTSCKELNSKNQINLKKNVSIRFEGEQGMGAGVTREWLDLLIKEMLNPDCALFTLSADGSTFQPNSNSSINPDHLNYFQFAGKIMGLALYHKHLITAYFTRSFYKHILGIPVNFKDVESIDPVFSKNLQTILDNDIDDLGLDIPFSVETSVFGEIQEVELKANGKNIVVTDGNKFEYVNLVADLKMTRAIRPQISAFLEGFYQFVPYSLVSLFNEYELELLLSGVPDIDLKDWRKNTSYQSGFQEDDQVIQWFWEVVENFTNEQQVNLLQFVTGTSRVPWGGFANLSGATGSQQFTICLQANSQHLLPTASTCFNMFKLPDYASKEVLEEKLKLAITYGAQGFEFA